MRELDDAEVGLGEDCEEVLADVGSNADLFAANQNQEQSTHLISEVKWSEAHMELDDAEVGLGEDCEKVLADVGSNADLYVANQEQSTHLISEVKWSEAHMEMEERPRTFRCVSWVKTCFTFSRLVLTKRIWGT